MDGIDARNEEIFQEFRADSTSWKYSLLDSVSVASAAAGIPTDSLNYYTFYTWRLDKEAQLIRLTSFSPLYFPGSYWVIDANQDSTLVEREIFQGFMELDAGVYKINLITEETLLMKRTTDYVGFDPFYGSGGGTTKRAWEKYVKVP